MGTRVGTAKELYSFTGEKTRGDKFPSVTVYELDTPVESWVVEDNVITGKYVAVSTVDLDATLELDAKHIEDYYGGDASVSSETVLFPVVDQHALAGSQNPIELTLLTLAFDPIADGTNTTPVALLADLGYTVL